MVPPRLIRRIVLAPLAIVIAVAMWCCSRRWP